jgi:hypothetical protein
MGGKEMIENESTTVSKDDICILIKFGKKKRLREFQSGKIYLKRLRYFIDLENETGDDDVGDKYDGLLPIEKVNIKVVNAEENHKMIVQFSDANAVLDLGYCNAPALCMFALDRRNKTEVLRGEGELIERYDFTDEQKEKLKRFGAHVLVITNNDEFISRLTKGFQAAGISMKRGRVEYYNGNTKQHAEDVINKDHSQIAFWKRQKFSYQQEYRLFAFQTDVDDHLIVDIGNISDISEIKSARGILNTYLDARLPLPTPEPADA